MGQGSLGDSSSRKASPGIWIRKSGDHSLLLRTMIRGDVSNFVGITEPLQRAEDKPHESRSCGQHLRKSGPLAMRPFRVVLAALDLCLPLEGEFRDTGGIRREFSGSILLSACTAVKSGRGFASMSAAVSMML